MYIKICISGLTAVGKTTFARSLIERYDATYISASEILLVYAQTEQKVTILPEDRDHFWLREKGRNLFLQRRKNPDLDKQIDEVMLTHLFTTTNAVIDSLTVPSLAPQESSAFFILLQATLHQRTQRAWLSSPTMTKKSSGREFKKKTGEQGISYTHCGAST